MANASFPFINLFSDVLISLLLLFNSVYIDGTIRTHNAAAATCNAFFFCDDIHGVISIDINFRIINSQYMFWTNGNA